MDFDFDIYRLCNPDLINMNKNELIYHWCNHGIYEGRIFCQKTFIDAFKKYNPFDKIASSQIVSGLKENKYVYNEQSFYSIFPYFNMEEYKKNNPDLGHLDYIQKLIHYNAHGKFENRICSLKIDPIKKIIGFSLWDRHEFYNYGMMENVLLAQQIYPDWICRIYYENCDPEILDLLQKQNNVELIDMTNNEFRIKLMWRFVPAFTEENIIFISRDADSRINIKEKLAVDAWLNSNYDFHIMRDNINHSQNIMGGMWGCRNNVVMRFKDDFYNYASTNIYNIDQQFLNEKIYPKIKWNSMIHASRHKFEKVARDFPNCDYNDFIGSYNNKSPKTFDLLNKINRNLEIIHLY